MKSFLSQNALVVFTLEADRCSPSLDALSLRLKRLSGSENEQKHVVILRVQFGSFNFPVDLCPWSSMPTFSFIVFSHFS